MKKNHSFTVFVVLGVGISLMGAAEGCSVATNTTAIQCTSESDCLSLGASFAGTTCDSTTRTCVRVAQDTDLCATNRECIAKASGKPAICRKSSRKCVKLTTPECPQVFAQPGELEDDDAVVIGFVGPEFIVAEGDLEGAAFRLMQQEVSASTKGLPGVNGSQKTRPLVAINCIEFTGFNGVNGGLEAGYGNLDRMTNHLVKDVGVPLIVGPVDSNHAKTMLDIMLPNRVLLIQPSGILSSLHTLPNPAAPTPMVWSTYTNDRILAKTGQAILAEKVEPLLRKKGITRPIRVAALAEGNSYGKTIMNSQEKILFLNVKSALDNATSGNYRYFDFGDLQDQLVNPDPRSKIAKVLADIFAFQPDVIMEAATPQGLNATFFDLALGWPANLPYPYQIEISSNLSLFPSTSDFIDSFPALHNTVFTTFIPLPPSVLKKNQEFAIKLKGFAPQFRDWPIELLNWPQGQYEAGWLAAYAIAANGNKPLTGENLGKTLPLLLAPGIPIRIGGDGASRGFAAAASGQGVDLEGIVTDLSLDASDGTMAFDLEVGCPGYGGDPKLSLRRSGYVVNAQTGKGGGSFNCLP